MSEKFALRDALWFTILLLVGVHLAEAQQPEKIRWIGYFSGSGSSPNQAFVEALRDLGYVEGKNIGFVFRSAEGKSDRYDSLAAELWRRAAITVDKVLKGAKAGDLPIEQPTKFQFVVNLHAAKEIGSTVPQRVLLKADRVIK